MYILPQQIKLFEGLEDSELLALLDHLPLRNYRKGLDVFQQGESSNEVFGILRGEIEILHRPSEGELQRIALLKPGEFFGEFSYLTGASRSSSAVATEDTVLIEMSEVWLKTSSERFESLQKRLVEMYRTRVLSNVLRGTKLFSVLDEKSLEKMGERFRYRRVEAETTLMTEGDRSAELMILKSGRLRVSKKKVGKIIPLGEIQPGEVVGEMALITGKPRSASVVADEKSEVMVLEEGGFRASLKDYPELYRRLREIVEFRAAKTREILDSLGNELAPGVASEAESFGGLGVKDLKLGLSVQCGDVNLQFVVAQVSSQAILLESNSPVSIGDGSDVTWAFLRSKKKSLQVLSDEGSLKGILFSKSKKVVEIKLDPSLRTQIVPLIQAMAKAKLQGLVYPEYPLESEEYQAEVGVEEPARRYRILGVSQTGMRLSGSGKWSEGEILPLKLFRGEAKIFEISAVCLSNLENEVEVQYEYDSEESKNQIDQFLRSASGAKRASLALEESRLLRQPAPADVPVLTRIFRSPREFVKTYISSIDQGFIKVRCKDALEPGTHVRLFLTIQDGASRRKALCEGRVKSGRSGELILDLEGSEGPLRERLQRLCQKIIDEKAQTEWKGREQHLREASYTVEGNIPDWVKLTSVAAGIALNIALYLWIYLTIAVPKF